MFVLCCRRKFVSRRCIDTVAGCGSSCCSRLGPPRGLGGVRHPSPNPGSSFADTVSLSASKFPDDGRVVLSPASCFVLSRTSIFPPHTKRSRFAQGNNSAFSTENPRSESHRIRRALCLVQLNGRCAIHCSDRHALGASGASTSLVTHYALAHKGNA